MKALVLSGGGDRGAFQAGVCFSLAQEGKTYDLFSGTSVGAIGAAYLSQFPIFREGANAYFKMWQKLSPDHIYKASLFGVLRGFFCTGIASAKPLQRTIYKNINSKNIRNSGKKLRIVTVNLELGETQVFDESSISIEKWIMASSSFPLFFECIASNDTLYTDGGVICNTPLSHAIYAGCDEIDVILTGPFHNIESLPPKNIKNAIDVGKRTIQILTNNVWKKSLRICHLINEGLNHGNNLAGKRKIHVTIYAPKTILPSKIMGFSPLYIREMLQKGIFSKGVSLADFVTL